jgi:hypothetical protein
VESVDTPVQKLLLGHHERMKSKRDRWSRYRAALANEFWSKPKNWPFRVDNDTIPIKREVNLMRSLIASLVTALFLQSPRVLAKLPNVLDAKPGRPTKVPPDGAAIVGRFVDDFLQRSDMRGQVNRTYSLALTYETAAFKIGFDDAAEGVDFARRLWFSALPPWEVVLDERVPSREEMRFIGHVRPESVDWIKDNLNAPKELIDKLGPRSRPDYVRDGYHVDEEHDQHRDQSFLLVYEHHDLVEDRLTFALAEHKDDAMLVHELDSGPLPYRFADGRPASTIQPVILDPMPEHPMEGFSVVDGLYEIAAEMNLMRSYLASACRRELSRVVMYLKRAGMEKLIDALKAGRDLEFVELDDAVGGLEGLFKALELPPIPQSFHQHMEALEQDRQAGKGTSDLAQGRQGKYISATEANILSKYSDAQTGLVALNMDEAINRACGIVLAVTRAELEDRDLTLRVDLGKGKFGRLDPKLLSLPWMLDMEDSSAAPAQEQQKKQEWQAAYTQINTMLQIASSPDTMPGPEGAEVPTGVTNEQRKFNQEAIDYTVSLHDLPDAFRWERLSQAGPVEEEDEEQPTTPSMEKAKAMLEGAGMVPADPTVGVPTQPLMAPNSPDEVL